MHPTAQKVAETAQALGLDITIKEFTASTRTAEDAAQAVGCTVGQIVKSLLFVVDGQPTMALVSGPNRLDEKKLADLCGVGKKKVKRATAEIVREATGFAIGGVPPFGHLTKLPVYIDEDFWQFAVVWAAAGTPNAVFASNYSPSMSFRSDSGEIYPDLRLQTAVWVDFSAKTASK